MWKKPEGENNYIQLFLRNHASEESGMEYLKCCEMKTKGY